MDLDQSLLVLKVVGSYRHYTKLASSAKNP